MQIHQFGPKPGPTALTMTRIQFNVTFGSLPVHVTLASSLKLTYAKKGHRTAT